MGRCRNLRYTITCDNGRAVRAELIADGRTFKATVNGPDNPVLDAFWEKFYELSGMPDDKKKRLAKSERVLNK